jgi:hypothetical protein
MTPWTWEELHQIERERGDNFVMFLAIYGFIGALALKLTRTMKDKMHDRNISCEAEPLYPNRCDGCPLRHSNCEPFDPFAKEEMTDLYGELLLHSRFRPEVPYTPKESVMLRQEAIKRVMEKVWPQKARGR